VLSNGQVVVMADLEQSTFIPTKDNKTVQVSRMDAQPGTE
jgi:hypothetical protein